MLFLDNPFAIHIFPRAKTMIFPRFNYFRALQRPRNPFIKK